MEPVVAQHRRQPIPSLRTLEGRAAAAKAALDEARWSLVRRERADDPVLERYDGLTPLEDLLTADEIAEVDRRLPSPEGLA